MFLNLSRPPRKGRNLTAFLGAGPALRFAAGVRDVWLEPEGVAARLLAVYYLPVVECKPEWLVYFTDPRCHTIPGLLAALREQDPDVDPDSYVSLIFFEVT